MSLGRIVGDIGGSHVRTAYFHGTELLDYDERPYDKSLGASHLLEQIGRSFDKVAHPPIEQAIYVVCAPFEGTTIVPNAINLPLRGMDLRKELKMDDLEFVLQRDNTAFAMAAYKHASKSGARRVQGTIIGTGVSSCIISEGIPECFERPGHECTTRTYADNLLNVDDVHEWLGARNIEQRFARQYGKELRLEEIWSSRLAAARKTRAGILHDAALYLSQTKKVFSPDAVFIGGGQGERIAPLLAHAGLQVSTIAGNPTKLPNTVYASMRGAIALTELVAAYK